jgi:hypothetical protein
MKVAQMSGISPPELGQALDRSDLPDDQSDAPDPEEEPDAGSGPPNSSGEEPDGTPEGTPPGVPDAPGVEHGSEENPDDR